MGGDGMMSEERKWHLQKWLEKERAGTWRGLDICHIHEILGAYQDYVKDCDTGFLDISMEVFIARWLSLAKQEDQKDGSLHFGAMWATRKK